MLALSTTLLAHQRGKARLPSLAVTASPTRAGVELLRWTRLYSGVEPDGPHALALAGDGSLVRARNAAGTLFISRVASPGPGSTYSAWTNLAACTAGTGVALAAKPAEVLLLYVTNGGLDLMARTSADNGATWSAAQKLLTEASAIGSLVVAFTAAGDACAFYTLGTSSTLKRLRRTAGAWAGAGTAWTNAAAVASLTGVAACVSSGDFQLVVTGTASGTSHKRAWGCIMGDLGLPANAWSGLVSIAESDSASTTTFAGPAIVVAGTNLHGFFAQREAGPVAANRVVYACPPAAGLATAQWTEPAPHEAVSPFGLSAAANGAAAWAATPSGVWSGPLAGVSTLSARVVACSYRLTPTSSRCRLELDNGDGALNGAPNAAFPGLLVGGSLSLAAGYLTVNGVPEFGVTPAFIVDALRYVVREGQATLVIEASGPWEALARWTPPQTWQVAAGTMTRSAIASRIAARAGFSLLAASNPLQPSNDWTAYSPAFAVVPGESGAAALQRLLSVVQDFVRADAGAFTVAGLQRYRNEVLSDLPSGYWRLGEATGAATAIDASGGGRSGVYNGTVVAGQAGPLAGDPGTVALFDGATGFVSVADDNAWSVNTTGRLTVEALVRLAAAPAGPVCVVGKGVAGNFEWELLILATGEPRWQIYDPGGASRAAATAASPIAAGAWYHLVGTVVDGVSCSLSVTPLASGLTATVTSNTFALTYANGPSTIGIGRRTDGSRLLSGPIGEVAVYSTALSAARIAAHVAAIDPVDYGYGTDHDLPSLELHDAPQAHNWLRAQGPDRYAEAATHSAVALNGARLRVFRNLDATSDDKARAWAVNALRREVVEDVAGELVAPFNAGQQLYDVVSVTEPRLGVAGARYRVIACGMEYRRGPKGARYDSVLTLGGV